MTTQSTQRSQQSLHPPQATTSAQVTALAAWQIESLQNLTRAEPILVTDDDLMSRTYYRALLADQFGLGMIDTWDPAEALNLCQTQPISLVISCLRKPSHLDGLDLIENLRRIPHTRYLPILMITATQHTREIALAAGANAYLNKPCHPYEILQGIWTLLRGRVL
jgi:putative two-component system response regulator